MELYTQFRNRQLQRQDWIPFNRIANWFSGEKGTGRIDDKHLTDTYRDLLSGLRLGEFDHKGRRTVHYLWFDKRDYDARLAGQWLIETVDNFLKEGSDFRKVVVPVYLVPCWVPRDVLLDWCKNNNRDPRPDWLEPPELEARKTKRGGERPIKHKWPAMRKMAFTLFTENGGPPGLDGPPGWQTNADLEEDLKDYCVKHNWPVPAHSSFYPEIKNWIYEYCQKNDEMN